MDRKDREEHLADNHVGFKDVLLVVAKRPAPGRTKTRLSPPLSPAQAATLYECFLRDTLDIVRKVPGVLSVIAYLPESDQEYFQALAPDFETIYQQGQSLGARLDYCLTSYLSQGFRSAVIMSSDAPTLPSEYLVDSFRLLEEGADVVIGPCDDGGYYLIGLKRPAPRLLREVRMSTSHVTADTLALAREEGLEVALLPTWYDVDDAQSLSRLVGELYGFPHEIGCATRLLLESAPFTPFRFEK